jgi:hypothetical protein
VQPYVVSNAVALLSLRRPSFCSVFHRPSDFSASCGLGLQLSERPSPSGLCSTPESATSCRRFRPTRAHGSHGLFRPPGFSPSSAQPGLHPISPHELSGVDLGQAQPKLHCRDLRPGSPGFPFPKRLAWLLVGAAETAPSRKPADPLELRTPFDHPRELETSTGPGVASSSIGVHHCPLTCSL